MIQPSQHRFEAPGVNLSSYQAPQSTPHQVRVPSLEVQAEFSRLLCIRPAREGCIKKLVFDLIVQGFYDRKVFFVPERQRIFARI